MDGQTVMTFQYPSIKRIDFVSDLNQINAKPVKESNSIRHRLKGKRNR